MNERDHEFGHASVEKTTPVSVTGLCFLAITVAACTPDRDPEPPPEPAPPARSTPELQVIVVGSGTPLADPARGGPATAVAMGERVLLFDAGAGVLRGLTAAGSDPSRVAHVFVTHLHSDHTVGLDELLFGAWTIGRDRPLVVHGPDGIEPMVAGLQAAFERDVAIRAGGLEGADPRGATARTVVVEPGVVHRERGIRVDAFAVEHGSWEHAYGYRVEGAGRVVVISGDTSPTDAVVDACDGCDVLVHEVYSTAGWRARPEAFRAYHAAFHTSGEQLGRLAARARPRLLVLTHLLFFDQPPAQILEEVRGHFDGEVVIAEDGERY